MQIIFFLMQIVIFMIVGMSCDFLIYPKDFAIVLENYRPYLNF